MLSEGYPLRSICYLENSILLDGILNLARNWIFGYQPFKIFSNKVD